MACANRSERMGYVQIELNIEGRWEYVVIYLVVALGLVKFVASFILQQGNR